MKIAILTPLHEELSILVSQLEQFGLQKKELRLGNLDIFKFNEADLLIAHGGHGKAQFGIQAQYLFCQEPHIQLLICVGAAGALSNLLKIGDIVVATETIEHDYNLKFVSRPLPRFPGNHQIIEILQKFSRSKLNFSVHFGSVASGDEDIVDVIRGRELASLTDCIAVGWEGAGGARACKFNNKCYLELRGITDTANHNAAEDFEINLATAMGNLAQFIVQWSKQLKIDNTTIKSIEAKQDNAIA